MFIVTGASSGVGQQLATFLYKHNARVYIATRSKEKADRAITAIRQLYPSSRGELIFLFLDLGDLTTIHKSADEFLNKESRLDVLWLNAGVMVPPQGSKTAQGYELQLGTNNIGHFLFTKLLHPVLFQTAQTSPADSVRVIWVSSGAVDLAPSPAIDFTNMDYHRNELAWTKYARSKAGSVLHATEFARRTKEEGIISLVSLFIDRQLRVRRPIAHCTDSANITCCRASILEIWQQGYKDICPAGKRSFGYAGLSVLPG